jgi:hypothetical protein
MVNQRKRRPHKYAGVPEHRLYYTTKSGIKIGCCYQRPLPELNHDEEIIQKVLLGIDPTNKRFKFWFTTYCMALVFVFTGLSTVRGRVTMWEVGALILAMLLVIVVGAVTLAVLFFAIEKLQAYGREKE